MDRNDTFARIVSASGAGNIAQPATPRHPQDVRRAHKFVTMVINRRDAKGAEVPLQVSSLRFSRLCGLLGAPAPAAYRKHALHQKVRMHSRREGCGAADRKSALRHPVNSKLKLK